MMISHDSAEAWSSTGDHSPGAGESVGSVEVDDRLVVRSPAMRALLAAMDRSLDAPYVLVEGETGTGKDLVARVFHRRAGAGERPFLVLDAPHLSPRRFGAELQRLSPVVTGGTLVVSEILDLSPDHQAFLSSVLDAMSASCGSERAGRILCVTQHDVDEEAREGRLLGALKERLRSCALRVPTLRERREDLQDLIRIFVQELAVRYGRAPRELSPEVWEVLLTHPWRGNVRELRNEIEQLVVLAPVGRPVGRAALSPALLAQSDDRSRRSARRERRNEPEDRRLRRRRRLPAGVPAGTPGVSSGESAPPEEGLRTWRGRARRRSRR